MNRPIPLHVEACLNRSSTAKHSQIRERIFNLLTKSGENLIFKGYLDFEMDEFLVKNVRYIILCEPQEGVTTTVHVTPQSVVYIHVYQLNEEENPAMELDDSEEFVACQLSLLPSSQYEGLWNSLIYDQNIKNTLLRYVSTAMIFSERKVDPTLITWNRLVLLHGPPGTGKTSLAKGLAQKLAIRLTEKYPSGGQLIEINSHSLFSKWFSESGKLVMKLFNKIRELVEIDDSFVCVLIDEVESLAAARKMAISGNEPSDAVRVVNAVLTQLDQLKSYTNTLIITTSNITGAIDLAFVDRADIKQYVGFPSIGARYHILSSCLEELMRVRIIYDQTTFLDYHSLKLLGKCENDAMKASFKLLEISSLCEGLSGRILRKLPFLAHSNFIQQSSVDLNQFLEALQETVTQELIAQNQLKETN